MFPFPDRRGYALSRLNKTIYLCHKPTRAQGVYRLDGTLLRGEDLGWSPEEVRFRSWAQTQPGSNNAVLYQRWLDAGQPVC